MKLKKQKKIIYLFTGILLLLFIVLSYFLLFDRKNENSILENTYPQNFFYRTFNYRYYLEKIQTFYSNKQADEEGLQQKVPTPTISKEEIIHDEKPTEIEDPKEEQYSEEILIYSSLTRTPGSISVSGTVKNVEVFYQEINKNKKDGTFSFFASTSYTVTIKGKKSIKKITITSPAYGTNKIINQLTLLVNPITMNATIIGQLNLILPGEIKGSLYNLSNSSSSSTVLKKGYFATSVSLQEGTNTLTATGEWLTIKLDLPTIQVMITN